MSTLIVLLGSEPSQEGDALNYALTDDGRSARECARAAVTQLPRASDLVVLVPPQRLSWHRLTLPRGSLGRSWWRRHDAQHLRRVLYGLLEDHLLEEAEAVHLALQPGAQEGTEVVVAACQRDWLREQLHSLRQRGLTPQRLLPLLPPDDDAALLHLVGEPEHPELVSLHGGLPVCLPVHDASLQWLQATQDTVLATPALAARGEVIFQQRLQVQALAQQLLRASQSNWNLAQFDFAAMAPSGARQRLVQAWSAVTQSPQWRPARWALLALLVVQLAGLQAVAWQTRTRLRTQHRELEAVLRQTFPQVSAVLDAPLQMEREVAQLRRASSAPATGDFESMLSALGRAGVSDLDALDYSPGTLRLRSKAGLGSLTARAAALTAQGYRVESEGERSVLRAQEAP